MKWHFATALLLVTIAAPARGDETPVYESLSQLTIGRVFYTQSERDVLDRRRGRPEMAASVGQQSTAATKKALPDKDAAGYIISSSGRSRIWKRGDFVSGSKQQVEDVSFPGEVDVQRHDEANGNED